MNPGLPEKYREKIDKKRLLTCKKCGHVIASIMKIPQCTRCNTYNEEK